MADEAFRRENLLSTNLRQNKFAPAARRRGRGEVDTGRCKPDSVVDGHSSKRPIPGTSPVGLRRRADAGRISVPYLVLLRKGFTLPRGSRRRAVGSYPTVSPLPRERGGFISVALSFPRRLVRGILPFSGTSCPMESGLSSPRREAESSRLLPMSALTIACGVPTACADCIFSLFR